MRDSQVWEITCSVVAVVAMLVGFVFSTVSVSRSYSWITFLSSVVCGVAFLCYVYILFLVSTSSDPAYAQNVRYFDWLMTLPLLTLKLAAMARDGPGSTSAMFEDEYVDLICAFAAIACVGLGYLGSETSYYYASAVEHATLFTLGTVAMCVDLSAIYLIAHQTETTNMGRIVVFSGAWAGYPLVYALKQNGCICAVSESTAYVVLDIYTKVAFAITTVF